MKPRIIDRKKVFPKFPELRTRRLMLREIKASDAQWYLDHFSRKEIVEGQGYPPPDGIRGAKEELERYILGIFRDRSGFRWGIQLKGRKGIIGSLGIYDWEKPYGHKAKMGYDLVMEHWGEGIMTEAAIAAIDFAFSKMNLTRIELTVMRGNRRSINLARRLGFKREGIVRQYGFNEKMELVDEELYSLLRSDWVK
ncbi:MAG: GNAT family N-acetyltransferase [Thermoplasmata archaeon]|jgi:ribosomal-protein-alanine N-acetyltransferase|nr:GNAT family N-acetyltransferase [Thermoplasmata archaeon]